MPSTRGAEPTRHEPPLETTRARLRDGQRVTARDYERALTELEAALDCVPTLCDLALPHVGRVLSRAGLLAKVRKAESALNSLLGA